VHPVWDQARHQALRPQVRRRWRRRHHLAPDLFPVDLHKVHLLPSRQEQLHCRHAK